MAGLFYLAYVVIAGLAGFARRGIIVAGDDGGHGAQHQWWGRVYGFQESR